MPEWVTIAAFGAILVACIFMWKRRDGRLWKRIVVSFVCLLVGVICVAGAYMNPYWNSIIMGMDVVQRPADTQLYAAAALQDLDYVMHYLKKVHPAAINGLPQAVRERYAEAVTDIKSQASISLMEFARLLQYVVAPLGDAHTSISLTFSHLDEPHTLSSWAEHEKRGDTLVGINGLTLEEIYDASRNLIIAEADGFGVSQVGRYAQTLEGLRYLGFPVEEGVVYTWERVDGVEREETVTVEDFLTPDQYEELYGEAVTATNSPVHWELDPENSLAILTLDSCVNNQQYKQSLKDMFTAIRDNGIQNLVVDLRENGGGDSSVIDEFMKYINVSSYSTWGTDLRLGPKLLQQPRTTQENERHNDLVFSGNLFVLTSPNTFSSAMMFAELIKDNGFGTIVGESPGNDPNGYGDVTIFRLPNSELLFNVSTKQWHRINSSAEGLIEPDIPVDAEEAMDELYEILPDLPYPDADAA